MGIISHGNCGGELSVQNDYWYCDKCKGYIAHTGRKSVEVSQELRREQKFKNSYYNSKKR